MTNRVFVFSIASSSGFTLIEVMISVVILTVSLLGVAGMYGFAAKFAYEARQQAHAVYMVNDILEGLRINKNVWFASLLTNDGKEYQLNIESGKNTSLYSECSIDHKSNHACRNSDLLRMEIANWQQHLDAAFSAGPASVCLVLQRQNAEAIVQAKVTINWVVMNAAPSSVIPVLDATCGDSGTGRRQFVVQTLL
ncbi:MAG: type IV pilus modification protein PilV [Tolumonas sp.]|nr:type IV pilus modification protein PilV [Tolumonas sp.]